jgi:hypothetical protein
MAKDKKPEKPTYTTQPSTQPRNVNLGNDNVSPNANKKGGSNK